jgi:hypothetical protein
MTKLQKGGISNGPFFNKTAKVSMLDKSVLLLFNLKYIYINVESTNECVLFAIIAICCKKILRKALASPNLVFLIKKRQKVTKNNRKTLTRSYLQQDNFATVKAYLHA